MSSKELNKLGVAGYFPGTNSLLFEKVEKIGCVKGWTLPIRVMELLQQIFWNE